MNELDAIWTAAAGAGKQMAREHKISEKKVQIREVTARKCGNCTKWMTSGCKPEKEHGQFKSMNSWACKALEFTRDSIQARDRWQAELAELEAGNE